MRRWLAGGLGLVAVAAVALAGVMRWEGIPLHAVRKTPPPGIESTALAVGAAAPPIALAASDGTAWRSADALASGPLVLVFYRGHW